MKVYVLIKLGSIHIHFENLQHLIRLNQENVIKDNSIIEFLEGSKYKI